MKKVIILVLIFNVFWVNAQDKTVTKNGKEIEVNKDASSTSKGIVKLAGDLGGTADLPTVPGLATKEPTIATGTTSQYWRGDKTWQTLDKLAVGLSNVDNTSDANKPISTATQTALNLKAPLASPSLTGSPTAPTATVGTNTTQIATTEFVTTAVSAATIADATASVKGKLKLAGDLGGTADLPTVPGLATKQNTLTLTTTGTGAATLTGATLNIPTPSLGTPFNLIGTSNDALSNKTDIIWRSGGLMIGEGINSSTSYNGYFRVTGNFINKASIFDFVNTSDANTGIYCSNGGGSSFLPIFKLSSNSANRSIFIGEVLLDSGAEPALQFRAQLQNLGPLVNRPAFTWVNGGVGGSELARFTANGRFGLGTTNPITRFHIGVTESFTTNQNYTGNLINGAAFNSYTNSGNEGGSQTSFSRVLDIISGSSVSGTAGSGIIRFLTNTNSEGASSNMIEKMRIHSNGFLGVGTNTPLVRLHVKGLNAQPATSGTTSNAILRIDGDTNHALDFGTYLNAPYGSYIQSIDKTNLAANLPLNLNPVSGNVGIGTNNPNSKLEINGASTNTSAKGFATNIIDFSQSNLAYTLGNPGPYTLQGIKDGGTYTLAIQGGTSGTATFTATNFTFRSPNNGPTQSNKHTLYTFIVMGTTVYFYMSTGL